MYYLAVYSNCTLNNLLLIYFCREQKRTISPYETLTVGNRDATTSKKVDDDSKSALSTSKKLDDDSKDAGTSKQQADDVSSYKKQKLQK